MRSKIEKKVIETIDQNRHDIIDFLRKLISFPSVTGEKLHIQTFIAHPRKLEKIRVKPSKLGSNLQNSIDNYLELNRMGAWRDN